LTFIEKYGFPLAVAYAGRRWRPHDLHNLRPRRRSHRPQALL